MRSPVDLYGIHRSDLRRILQNFIMNGLAIPSSTFRMIYELTRKRGMNVVDENGKQKKKKIR